MSNIHIISFYMDNIPAEIVALQAQVFQELNVPLNQIRTLRTHSYAIEDYLARTEYDAIVIFDIDCIPLRKDVIEVALMQTAEDFCIYGAAQRASHIANSRDYVSPAFMSFSKSTYERLGCPSFEESDDADVGAQLTYRAYDLGARVVMLRPTSVEEPQWILSDGTPFGHGTNYADQVFHAFEIRRSRVSQQIFRDMCLRVLGG